MAALTAYVDALRQLYVGLALVIGLEVTVGHGIVDVVRNAHLGIVVETLLLFDSLGCLHILVFDLDEQVLLGKLPCLCHGDGVGPSGGLHSHYQHGYAEKSNTHISIVY